MPVFNDTKILGDLFVAGEANLVKAKIETKNIIGTSESVYNIKDKKVWFHKGALFYGTAADAGLVTRGISGIKEDGSKKDHLFLNYDGNNNYEKKVVLGAGNVGNDLGGGLWSHVAARGDAVEAYVTDKISQIEFPETDISHLATKNELTSGLSVKADKTALTTAEGRITTLETNSATKTELTSGLSGKVDKVGSQTIKGTTTLEYPTAFVSGEQPVLIAKVPTSATKSGSISIVKEGPNSGIGLKFEQEVGITRLMFRGSSTPGAMVWAQPEANSTLYLDVGSIDFRSSGFLLRGSDFSPKTNNTKTIGTSSRRFNEMHATTFYASGNKVATEAWVENKDYLSKSGDMMEGALNLGDNVIVNVPTIYGNGGAGIKFNGYTTEIYGDVYEGNPIIVKNTEVDFKGKNIVNTASISVSRDDILSALQTSTYNINLTSNVSQPSYSVAIGYGASGTGTYSVVIGYDASSTSSYSVAIGRLSSAASSAVGIGAGTTTYPGGRATATGSVAIGRNTLASGSSSIAIGYNATATGNREIQLGDKSYDYTLQVGKYKMYSFSPIVQASADPLQLRAEHLGVTLIPASSALQRYVVDDITNNNIPIGGEIHFYKRNTTAVRIYPTGGTQQINGNAFETHYIDSQYSFVTLKKIAANEWAVFGNLA